MSKETFKEFIKTKPYLKDYVLDGTTSWQHLYEIYDLYGESSTIWNEYKEKTNTKLTDIIKNIDPDKLQEQLTNVEKALTLITELTTKNIDTSTPSLEKPRPITKFFGE